MSLGADLLALQDLDLELERTTKELQELPILSELAKKRATYAKLKSESTKILARRKDAEIAVGDLDDAERSCHEKIAGIQNKQATLTDYRSVQDLEIELSLLAKRLDKIAFDRPAAEKSLEDIKQKEDQLTGYIKRFEQAILSDAKTAREEAEVLQGRIEASRQKRERLASKLPADTLQKYEQTSRRFKGIGVERLEGKIPSVCRTVLQTASMDQLRHASDIAECPYCHRILVLNEGE